MKAFIYDGELYIRCIPGKRLFSSTMVHEVVNRGDIFAVRCSDQQLTIVPGTAEVQHISLDIEQIEAPLDQTMVPVVALFKIQLHLKKAYDNLAAAKQDVSLSRTHLQAAMKMLEVL